MRWLLFLCTLAITLATATWAAPLATGYTFTLIDNPSATADERTEALGINSSGHIVGRFGRHGFVYDRGDFTTIDVPGAHSTIAFGINESGHILGSFVDSTERGSHGFLYVNGVFTTFDVPGAGTANGPATRAFGINSVGDIVGDFDVQVGAGAETHAYLYRDGVFTVIDFPSAYSTQAFGINDRGDIVGSMAFPGIGGASGFVYSGGTFSRLNHPSSSVPPGADHVTVALGINNRRQIVGFFTLQGVYRGFVFDDGRFTTLDGPAGSAGQHFFAWGINEAGHIVGSFNSPTGNHGFLATPIHGQ